MQRLKNWLTSKDTPRWSVAVGFVLSTLFSVGLGMLTDNIKRQDDNRAQQARALQESMVQFQIFVSALSSEMFEKKSITSEARNNVIKNLNEQYARSKALESMVSAGDKQDLSSYRDAITKMIDATRQVEKLTEMGDFWTAASRLLVARNKLDSRLKNMV